MDFEKFISSHCMIKIEYCKQSEALITKDLIMGMSIVHCLLFGGKWDKTPRGEEPLIYKGQHVNLL